MLQLKFREIPSSNFLGSLLEEFHPTPPSTFDNGSHVNQNRHISCRVPRDQPVDELYRRRPYTSASMYGDLGCLWPVLADPDLSFGERRYLYSVACIYNVNPMKQTKQEQYYQLLYKELMKGYYPSEVHQRYLHYLTSPRKTQFGKLDPEKRAKSAPPPPTLHAQHGQTTPTRVTSGRTTSRMSKRSSGRPSSISSHPSTSSNKRSKSASSRSQSASTVKSGSSQQHTANEVKHKESNNRDVVQANHKKISHVGDDQGKLTRNEEQDHRNKDGNAENDQHKPQSNTGSPPKREELYEDESNENSPRVITVVSENIKPSTATHTNRDDLDKREGDRRRESGSFSSTGSRSIHHDQQSHSPSFFQDGKKTSDKEHEALHNRESTDEEVITTIHRTQSYEQERQSNTHTEEKRSTHSRPDSGVSQGKEYVAPNRLAKNTSQGSSLKENNQPLNESQAQDEYPLVTVNQTDQGADSDDALPEFSTQERNHDVDKIEY
ncbi:nuclear speckle splicing regulatory protein 1-like isoform X2 [Pomacea canaliculata]|uniref:nuclear speckle splicing regulatory protein 1-like isoform X2 n=1 Tax=Pomacea canaliculata TaxID=400727 RepID=UPI000D7288D4|nr:nuclear speckle splicing regulatory protein 1-like isoform X2 [Pomacea canaliculata]